MVAGPHGDHDGVETKNVAMKEELQSIHRSHWDGEVAQNLAEDPS